jgi:hypothetical protein
MAVALLAPCYPAVWAASLRMRSLLALVKWAMKLGMVHSSSGQSRHFSAAVVNTPVCFEDGKGKPNGCSISDWLVGSDAITLGFLDSSPEVLDWVIRVPGGCQEVAVGFDFFRSDEAVGCLEMGQHGATAYIGETEIGVFENAEVAGGHGLEDLLLELFGDVDE